MTWNRGAWTVVTGQPSTEASGGGATLSTARLVVESADVGRPFASAEPPAVSVVYGGDAVKIKDADIWKSWVDANTDTYGKACVDYAEAWANDMERRMESGETIEQMADASSHEVDRRPEFGITGFMYGAAVSMLSRAWEHGEELRRWHNLKTQIRDEGERANESGGVLNPALLRIEETP